MKEDLDFKGIGERVEPSTPAVSPGAQSVPVAQSMPAAESVPAAPAPPRRPRPGAARVAAVASVLAVAFLVLSAFSFTSMRHRQSADNARDSALAAARTYAVDIGAYDYHQLDQDFGAVLSHSTPAWAKTYSQSTTALKNVLTKYSATAEASVLAAGIESASTSHAVALVFLNQTVKNTLQKGGPVTVHDRLQISLVRSGSAWQIDLIKLL